MKLSNPNFKRLFALVTAIAICTSMSTIVSAADVENVVHAKTVDSVIAQINAEYGTNIHILTQEELEKYDLPMTATQTCEDIDIVSLEEELRHVAEVEIPQFEHITQDALRAATSVNFETNGISDINTVKASGPVIAKKAINYATAGAKAYITKDSYGNNIWGNVENVYCYTNMYQSRWFLSVNPSVTRIDGRGTLYWKGTGDYCAYINGQQYYLYSGTQYAEMYVGKYI